MYILSQLREKIQPLNLIKARFKKIKAFLNLRLTSLQKDTKIKQFLSRLKANLKNKSLNSLEFSLYKGLNIARSRTVLCEF